MADLRICILGERGLLGRALASRASAHAVSLCRSFTRTDITRADSVAERLAMDRADVVINAAGYTDVDGAQSDASNAWRVNADGAAIVTAACAATDTPLLHLSTDYVFDGEAGRPYDEQDAARPLGVYGMSKLAGESAVLAYERGTVLRTAWLYDGLAAGFTNTMVRAAERHPTLTVAADQWGSPTHVDDLADALLTLARRVFDGATARGVYHMAGCDGVDRHRWVSELFARLGLPNRVDPVAASTFRTAARRPTDSRLDCARLAREHGIELPDWRSRIDALPALHIDAPAALRA